MTIVHRTRADLATRPIAMAITARGMELSVDDTVGAAPLAPTTLAATPVGEAFAALDRDDGKRLVVLADDGDTYVRLVCLRGHRDRLCVDAELDPHPIERITP